MKLLIDPAHGGEKKGYQEKGGLTAKEANLALAHELRELLFGSDIEPLMTRLGDTSVPISARIRMTKTADADALLVLDHGGPLLGYTEPEREPILCGTCSIDGAASPCKVTVRACRANQGSWLLGACLRRAITETLISEPVIQVHAEQVHSRKHALLYRPECPSVIVVASHLSHAFVAQAVRSGEWSRKVAAALFRGLNEAMPKLHRHDNDLGQAVQPDVDDVA